MSAKLKARLKKLLAQEKGAVVRDWGARWPVALVYPQIYPVAMGNLGFQAIYRLLNDTSGLHCERAFLPSPEDWEEYRRTRTPILSLESQRPLRDFAAVAFSISFEADYPYVLQILEGAGIPLLAAERRPGDPLVLAGGVATFFNPEPLAPFVDAFFLGEGEAGAVPFFQFLAEGEPEQDRHLLLRDLAQTIPGAYVPAGYTPRYQPDGTLAAFEPEPGFPPTVRARTWRNWPPTLPTAISWRPRANGARCFWWRPAGAAPGAAASAPPGLSTARPGSGRWRSCGSRFSRNSWPERKVGLVGAAVSDHPEVKELCRKILEAGGDIGISSLRADSADEELFRLLVQGGVQERRPGPGGRQRPAAAGA